MNSSRAAPYLERKQGFTLLLKSQKEELEATYSKYRSFTQSKYSSTHYSYNYNRQTRNKFPDLPSHPPTCVWSFKASVTDKSVRENNAPVTERGEHDAFWSKLPDTKQSVSRKPGGGERGHARLLTNRFPRPQLRRSAHRPTRLFLHTSVDSILFRTQRFGRRKTVPH